MAQSPAIHQPACQPQRKLVLQNSIRLTVPNIAKDKRLNFLPKPGRQTKTNVLVVHCAPRSLASGNFAATLLGSRERKETQDHKK